MSEMGLRRSSRERKAIDYKALGSKGRKIHRDDEQECIKTTPDSDEEHELPEEDSDGSGSNSSESETETDDMEEGELEGTQDAEEEIDECMETENIKKLKEILKREDKCNKLQQQVKRVKEKDRKRKEMESLVSQIKQMDKKKATLQRSLESSRASTPRCSPVKSKKEKRKNEDIRVVKKKKRETGSKDYSEYEDTLRSMVNLKQGNGDENYTELMMKALEATDNILSIKSKQVNKTNNKGNKTSKEGQ